MRIADVDVDVEEILDRLGIKHRPERGQSGWVTVLCPFHAERKPSFGVNLIHGGWIDFHTGDTGTLVSLVENLRNTDTQTAIEWLRQRQVSATEAVDRLMRMLWSFGCKNEKKDVEGLRKWAAHYDSLDPNLMAKYFLDRGFTWHTIRKFEVRYSPAERAVIWPVRDRLHNLHGFIMRRVQDGCGSRYVYSRGFTHRLFPLNHYVGPTAVLVEGPLDAMWLHQCGIPGGLALCGTALSRGQLEELKGLARSVILAMDNDRAGRLAQRQLVKKITRAIGMPKLVQLPDGVKDIQELAPEKVHAVLSTATVALADMLRV